MSNEQEHEPPKWGDVVRYVTDDRDYVGDDRLELQVQFGNNGDWYVSIAPEGRRAIRGVRLSTSGGASFNRPGMTAAVAALYRAMRGEHEQQDLDGLPSVAGEYTGTLEDFERSARQCIADIQESFMPDNALVGVLCDAVRIARSVYVKQQRLVERMRVELERVIRERDEERKRADNLEHAVTMLSLARFIPPDQWPKSRDQRFAFEIDGRGFFQDYPIHQWRVNVRRAHDRGRDVYVFTLEPR